MITILVKILGRGKGEREILGSPEGGAPNLEKWGPARPFFFVSARKEKSQSVSQSHVPQQTGLTSSGSHPS